MDIIQLGAQLLSEKLGLQIDPASLQSALTNLLGNGQGTLDLAGLAEKMAASGQLGNILNSWLGDGANAAISPESIQSLLGSQQVSEFASRIGTSSQTAAAGLAEVIPQIMDRASSGGNLLASAGGIGGLMNAAKSFLS
jgi:uncharacterized protein YidB (DUF937 family)